MCCGSIEAMKTPTRQDPGTLKAPFPWFGGKSAAAATIWWRSIQLRIMLCGYGEDHSELEHGKKVF